MVASASIELPAVLVEQIAQRTAELLRERPPAPSPFLTVNEAAGYLRSSKQRIYDLTSAGRLRAHRDGRRLLFTPADLDDVLDVPEGGGGA
jgi:excisionase family DNA binding protein